MYQVTERLSIGLEANPIDDDYGPLANWRALDETETRPALIFGTSSDRIGTPSGRAVYGTFSKDLESILGIPVAPYVGVNYSGFDHDFDAIGGLNIRWPEKITSTHLYDGENIHHIIARDVESVNLGFLIVEQDSKYYFGLTLAGGL